MQSRVAMSGYEIALYECYPFWGQSLAKDKPSVPPEGCAMLLENILLQALTRVLYLGFRSFNKKILQLWLPLTLVLRDKDRIVAPINMTKVVFQQEMQLLQCFKLGRMHTEIPDVE